MTATGIGVVAGVAILNSVIVTVVTNVRYTDTRFYILVLWPYVVAILFAKFVK